ncbi:restriction endonuclease subunit S [Methanobacterium formicicum]|uniref:Type I restriction modification DNA specificity domain-containing protein n=1 Tax=Methanobacterium formicicum TaxID=2162 RepID=A0A0S4FLY1_METFO|nr:restriction endonuclease subunit S [Methanobacterium formicicum]CEL23999.1 hypothetical protein MB9_0351 [Methanobacterium formicicum]
MEYKDTPVGMIPMNWDIFRLGDEEISTLIMGQSPPSSTYNKEGNGLPFLQGKAEFGDMNPNPILSCTDPMKIAEKDDLLLSIRAPVGEVNIATEKYCIGRGLAAIRTKKDKLNNIFLFNYIKMSGRRFEVLSTGSTFKAVKKGDIENFIIPVPPLSEQQKIAEILSTTDEAIQKSDEIIAKTEHLKKGMMQKLLTEGIGHDEFKDTVIGPLPVNWELLELKDVGNFQYGFTASAQEHDTGVRFLRITDIAEDGTIKWNKVPYCSVNPNIFKKYELSFGDIVFARLGATSGKAGFIEQNDLKSIFASYLIRLKVHEDINSKLIFYMVQSSIYWSQVLRQREGQLKKGMNANMLSHIKIPLPVDISEQQKIAEILSNIDEFRLKEVKRKLKLQKIKKGLMNDLLTGRKRVQVNN